MFCPECGNHNPDTAKFCIKCGHKYAHVANRQSGGRLESQQNTDSNQSVFSSTPSSQNNARTQGSGKRVLIGATVVILLVGILLVAGTIALVAYQQRRLQSNEDSTASASQDSQPIVPRVRRGNQRLVEPAFVVGSRRYYYVKFIIPDDWSHAAVVGNFTASGGEGNDVQVFITDESGLTNIQNGHSARVWYDSGKVTTDNIKTKLGSGTYYIVFSNSFSLISNKAIRADIQLQYEY